ncbi:MAG: LacI family transcriptional regulator [Lentisphaerae bacterium]|nr:LacI family transcriptional regulator [Lentisphaerota bacterium]
MSVTILDIARATGKSYPTVSRALNGHPRISVRTREEICAAAERLGYRRNFAGVALKTGRTGVLAVIVPNLLNPFYAEFLRCFKAAASGYEVIAYDYELCREKESKALERLLTGFCDGATAFISDLEANAKVVERIHRMRIPLVTVGTMGYQEHPIDYVGVENSSLSSASAPLVELLMTLRERGRKQAAFIAGMSSLANLDWVAEVTGKTFADLGFDFQVKRDFLRLDKSSGNPARDGFELARRRFSEHPQPDLFFVLDCIQTYGVLCAAARAGKVCGVDFDLISSDYTWVSEYSSVPCYAIHHPLPEMTAACFDFIQRRLAGDWKSPQFVKKLECSIKGPFQTKQPGE